MKLLAYKSISSIEASIAAGDKRVSTVNRTLKRLDKAISQLRNNIVAFPVHAHIRFIKFRIRMTDKYLKTKAEACEAALKVMSHKRKQIAQEQLEARQTLKKLRNMYEY